jgi:GGDEF domain-containing protein
MPTRPIALELSRPPDAGMTFDARPTLVGIIEDLISLLEAQMPDEPDFPAEPLRQRLSHSRTRVRTAGSADTLHDAGLRLIGDASQVHARMAGHVTGRESEFLGVIRLLRELVDGLRGDARAFRADVTESSARVAGLAEMDDIRSLRRALSREVDQLRQKVQTREREEATRLASVSSQLEQIDGRVSAAEVDLDRATNLPRRGALERRLAGHASGTAWTLVVVRIDEPDDIVADHGRDVLDRVILCVAQLLQTTFSSATPVHRVDTHTVVACLTAQHARTAAQALRQAQARLAPEYEYEAHGTRRSVMFTFSSGVADRHSGESAADLIHRAETLAAHAAGQGRGRMEVAGSRLGRLLGWM